MYLPKELKESLGKVARRRGMSEASFMREALAAAVGTDRPRPQGALFEGSEPIADRVDELLEGFGER